MGRFGIINYSAQMECMEMRKTLLVAAISGMVSGAMVFSLPLYLDARGYSLSEIGWVFGIAAFIGGVIGIGIGALSDRFGRRPLIAFYNLMTGLGAFIIGWLSGIYAFILGKAIRDSSATHLWGAYVSRIGDITEDKERGRALGKFALVYGSAFSVTFALAGYVLENSGFAALFTIVIFLSLLVAASAFALNELGKRTLKTEFSLQILKTRNGVANSLISFCTGFGDALIYSYFVYLFLMKEYSLSILDVGLLITGLFLLWSVACYFSGGMTDRYGIRKMLVIGALCVASVWLLQIFFWENFLAFIILVAFDNVSWSIYSMASTKLSSVIPKRENLGRDVAVFTNAHILGAVIGVTVAGMLAEISYASLFMAKVAAMLAAALLVWYGIRLKEEA